VAPATENLEAKKVAHTYAHGSPAPFTASGTPSRLLAAKRKQACYTLCPRTPFFIQLFILIIISNLLNYILLIIIYSINSKLFCPLNNAPPPRTAGVLVVSVTLVFPK
jgi:hypothetical protein